MITNIIWAIQMPGFMLVSGYFSCRVIRSGGELWKRILKSVQCYALPFFSWYILVDTLLLGRNGRNPINAIVYLITHVDSGLWFLWTVFALSILAALINFSISSKTYKVIKTVLVLMLYFCVLLLIGKLCGLNFLGIKYILYYSVFYALGWIVKKTESQWKDKWNKISELLVLISLLIFAAIVFNFDLYRSEDNIIGIGLRVLSGLTGNLIIVWLCLKYKNSLSKMRLKELGKYTLEIYVTHVYFTGLMMKDSVNGLFTVMGFGNFLISLLLTCLFALLTIKVIRSNKFTEFIFFGKHMTRQW